MHMSYQQKHYKFGLIRTETKKMNQKKTVKIIKFYWHETGLSNHSVANVLHFKKRMTVTGQD